jgi:nucleotide-binding universal stress UspA family protein
VSLGISTLVEYARINNADQIVIGAPPVDMSSSEVTRTVAFRVMNEAPCSVTVVRARGSGSA